MPGDALIDDNVSLDDDLRILELVVMQSLRQGFQITQILVTRPHHKCELRCGLVSIFFDLRACIAGELHDWGKLKKRGEDLTSQKLPPHRRSKFVFGFWLIFLPAIFLAAGPLNFCICTIVKFMMTQIF